MKRLVTAVITAITMCGCAGTLGGKLRNSELPVFDLAEVECKVISSAEATVILTSTLDKTKTVMKNYFTPFDWEYLLYTEKTIRKVEKLFPPTIRHDDVLDEILEHGDDGSDCDNTAERRSYYFHSLLPACCAISLTQPGHRFMGVMSTDNGIIWFGGDPVNGEYVKDVTF